MRDPNIRGSFSLIMSYFICLKWHLKFTNSVERPRKRNQIPVWIETNFFIFRCTLFRTRLFHLLGEQHCRISNRSVTEWTQLAREKSHFHLRPRRQASWAVGSWWRKFLFALRIFNTSQSWRNRTTSSATDVFYSLSGGRNMARGLSEFIDISKKLPRFHL